MRSSQPGLGPHDRPGKWRPLTSSASSWPARLRKVLHLATACTVSLAHQLGPSTERTGLPLPRPHTTIPAAISDDGLLFLTFFPFCLAVAYLPARSSSTERAPTARERLLAQTRLRWRFYPKTLICVKPTVANVSSAENDGGRGLEVCSPAAGFNCCTCCSISSLRLPPIFCIETM